MPPVSPQVLNLLLNPLMPSLIRASLPTGRTALKCSCAPGGLGETCQSTNFPWQEMCKMCKCDLMQCLFLKCKWMAPISHRSLAGGRSSSPGLSEGCWCAREAFYHETRVSWHILAQVVTVPSWRIKTFQDHGEPGAAFYTIRMGPQESGCSKIPPSKGHPTIMKLY
jgi:hypothetical protein